MIVGCNPMVEIYDLIFRKMKLATTKKLKLSGTAISWYRDLYNAQYQNALVVIQINRKPYPSLPC